MPTLRALWGMARVLVQEHPDLPVRCIDLPADPEATNPSALIQELYADGDEDMVAHREEQRFVARLVRYREADVGSRPELPIAGDASYLVTGGTGGLGLRVPPRYRQFREYVQLAPESGQPTKLRPMLRATVKPFAKCFELLGRGFSVSVQRYEPRRGLLLNGFLVRKIDYVFTHQTP